MLEDGEERDFLRGAQVNNMSAMGETLQIFTLHHIVDHKLPEECLARDCRRCKRRQGAMRGQRRGARWSDDDNVDGDDDDDDEDGDVYDQSATRRGQRRGARSSGHYCVS